MNTTTIVVLDDGNTWSTVAGAQVVIAAHCDHESFVPGSGQSVTIEQLIRCWQSQQVAQ